jgi:hypothetical protein
MLFGSTEAGPRMDVCCSQGSWSCSLVKMSVCWDEVY